MRLPSRRWSLVCLAPIPLLSDIIAGAFLGCSIGWFLVLIWEAGRARQIRPVRPKEVASFFDRRTELQSHEPAPGATAAKGESGFVKVRVPVARTRGLGE